MSLSRSYPSPRVRLLLHLTLLVWIVAVSHGFVGLLGVQADEVLFTLPYFEPEHVAGGIEVGGVELPMMIMSYVGATKSWFLRLVYIGAGYGVWSLRFPAVLLGALTIGLTYWVVREAVSETAARIAALLLASDSTFVLTTVYDWGPVALQHAAYVASVTSAVLYLKSGRRAFLFFAGFLAGIGLWDKVLFAWVGVGSIVGLLVCAPGMFRHLSRQWVLIAGSAILGAFPVLYYNVQWRLASTEGMVAWEDLSGIAGKAYLLWSCFSGTALLDFFSNSHAEFQSRALHPSQLGVAIAASAIGCLVLTRGRARQAGLFCLVAAGLTLAQMWLLKGAGGSAHHTVLVYPLPHALVGCFAGGLLHRFRAAWLKVTVYALTGVVAAQGIYILCAYHRDITRIGADVMWSDAQFGLTREIESHSPPIVYVNDWGILEPLRFHTAGRIPMESGTGVFWGTPKEEVNRAEVAKRLRQVAALHVKFGAGVKALPPCAELVDEVASKLGCQRETVKVIRDRVGWQAFEVYRFRGCPAVGP